MRYWFIAYLAAVAVSFLWTIADTYLDRWIRKKSVYYKIYLPGLQLLGIPTSLRHRLSLKGLEVIAVAEFIVDVCARIILASLILALVMAFTLAINIPAYLIDRLFGTKIRARLAEFLKTQAERARSRKTPTTA